MRKRKPTNNPPTSEAAPPPPPWTRMPPMTPSAFALANLDWAERDARRDQYSRDMKTWEREQAQELRAQAWELRMQAREEELRRALTEALAARAESQAARSVAKRAVAGDRGLAQANAKTLATMKAIQRDVVAKGGPKPTAKRGRKGFRTRTSRR